MREFINPYNFIPFNSQRKSKEYEDCDKHTGVIEYTITPLTPLFIPDAENDKTFSENKNSRGDILGEIEKHKSYDFYSYHLKDGAPEPVIPGSELRGMIRSIYETLTGSCMGILNENKHVEKRTGQIFDAALIHKKQDGSYELIEANSWRIDIYKAQKDAYREGQAIYFRRPNNIRMSISDFCSTMNGNCRTKGYLIKSGWNDSDSKNRYHVLVKKNNGNVIKNEFDSSDREMLQRTIDSYINQSTDEKNNDYNEYNKRLQCFLDGQGENDFFPVYVSKIQVGETILWYYSPSAITKEISNSTIGARVGDWLPCKYIEHCCPACSLFGMVGVNDKKERVNARASKIRITDAYLDRKAEDYSSLYEEKPITLQILNSPKISNSEFYLNRPETANFWTYDYYIEDGNVKLYDEGTVLIRGRKFYWHQPDMTVTCVKPSKMNMTIRPLKRNSDENKIQFNGKIFFDNISNKQLNQLIWILNGGDQNSYCYKLGAAKPFGYGSVKLKVKNVKERKFIFNEIDGKISYKEVNMEFKWEELSYKNVGFDNEVKDAFIKISSFNTLKGKNVSYPITLEQRNQTYGEGEDWEGFKWFENQKPSFLITKRTDEQLIKMLPDIGSDRMSLPMKVSPKCKNNECNKMVGWDARNNKWYKYCQECSRNGNR